MRILADFQIIKLEQLAVQKIVVQRKLNDLRESKVDRLNRGLDLALLKNSFLFFVI